MGTLPESIQERVKVYERDRRHYKSPAYNEETCRFEFINPFFKALGWDVTNERGLFDLYKDVEYEGALRMGKQTKAPDYAFRIGGQRVFFVEAKKPEVYIYADNKPAYQLRRYAWTAGMPLSVLTNFAEFAVYDTSVPPSEQDGPHVARVFFCKADEYEKNWEYIEQLLSKHAVERGSVHRFGKTKKKRGAAAVDGRFLNDLESWRELLAKHIAEKNPGLGGPAILYAVQTILNRILFIRICEDRGIEPLEMLNGLRNGANRYPRMVEVFREMDRRYDSGLFHFADDGDHASPPDRLTPGLVIPDGVVAEVLRGLYYPVSPYAFEVIPVSIIGSVYERFLGKTIETVGKMGIKVVEKPEVRHAGGVYYTPSYIVDRVVDSTLRPLFDGHEPSEVANLTIVDPACGSGSFLLGAYDWLLRWYLERYAQEPEKWRDRVFSGANGAYSLTLQEKRRILVEQVHGVDLDSQAVEVTKFSLLIKLLEGESAELLERQARGRAGKVLPNLDHNIRCGNSLVGTDFYTGPERPGTSEDALTKLRPFDWAEAFPAVFRNGGFSAVVGNPPYVRIQTLTEWAPEQAAYLKRAYRSAGSGSFDLYMTFIEKSLKLVGGTGRVGFILPNKFLTHQSGQPLRRLLAEEQAVDQIVDFGPEQVFEGATTYTCLLFLDRSRKPDAVCLKVDPVDLALPPVDGKGPVPIKVGASTLTAEKWVFADDESGAFRKRIEGVGRPLSDYLVAMSRGSSTGADDVFCLKKVGDEYYSAAGKRVDIEPEALRVAIGGGCFWRYRVKVDLDEMVVFPYVVTPTGVTTLSESQLLERWPKAHAYLTQHKAKLEARKGAKGWHLFSAPRALGVHDHADIWVPLLANEGAFTLAMHDRDYCMLAGGGLSIKLREGLNPAYVLALLNSRLLFWYLRQISKDQFRGGWMACTKQHFETMPIRVPDMDNTAEKAVYDKIVTTAHRLIELNQRLHAAIGPDQARLTAEIRALDSALETQIHGLYGVGLEEADALLRPQD